MSEKLISKEEHAASMAFPIGKPNENFGKYFTGQSYLEILTGKQCNTFNITFEPGCRTCWHTHTAESGGGHILLCLAGEGIYQEEGKEAVVLRPGDVVNTEAGVKHWHGASPDSWFSHIAIEIPGVGNDNEWLEPVTDEVYNK